MNEERGMNNYHHLAHVQLTSKFYEFPQFPFIFGQFGITTRSINNGIRSCDS